MDCYVLDDERRVISMRATVKAIANDTNGDLAKYVGVRALHRYISADEISAKIIEFEIPGNPIIAKGVTAETFLEICSAYVSALAAGENLTEKQTSTAINCSIGSSTLGWCIFLMFLCIVLSIWNPNSELIKSGFEAFKLIVMTIFGYIFGSNNSK